MTRVPHQVGDEERNIPIRICLTRAEWDALSEADCEVYEMAEAVIAAVVSEKRFFQRVVKASGS